LLPEVIFFFVIGLTYAETDIVTRKSVPYLV